uniref:Tetratricopeptide TPR_2 repeat protein n=1 Tax=Solibacter usitatus (strain Ellin6076) TaxID=234267 RepID=Q01XI3_SOLUE
MQSSDKPRSSLSAVSIVFLAVFSQACSSNPFATKEEYVRRGRQFTEQGNYADATLQFRKALQKDASYGEAYLRYGQLLNKTGNHAEAFQSLSRAADLMPASEEAKVELGNLAITALLGSPGRPPKYYETAVKISGELLVRNPKSFDGLRLKGLLALADGHLKEAIDSLRAASAVRPDRGDVSTQLVQALLAENRQTEAENTARTTLTSVRNYGPLYDALYGYYMSANLTADAEQLMKSKVANNPKEPFYVIQLADHYWRQKKAPELDALLRDFVAKFQQYPKAPMDAGDFYQRIGKLEQAIALYQKGLESDRTNRKDYLKRIVDVRMQQSRFDEATATVDSILTEFPGDLDAIASRAALRMTTGKPTEIQRARDEFGALLKRDPQNNELRFNLARASRQAGDETQARSALVEILRRDPNHRNALRELADLEIQNQRPDEALQYAERLIALEPANIGARLVRTAAWALRGPKTEVRAELRRMIAERPDMAEPALQMATLEMDQGNYAEAERSYQRLRATPKFDIRPLRGLVVVYQAQGQSRKALDLVQQESKRTNDIQVRTLLATTAAQAGDLDLALSTAQAILNDIPQDPKNLIFMGQLLEQKGQMEQAIVQYDRARQLAPKDGLVAARYGLALVNTGRTRDGIAALRESVRLQPESPLLMNNLAWYLAVAGTNLDEAQSLAQRAAQKEPANSTFSDTLGVVFLKAGKADNAIQILQALVRKEPASPTYRLHLAWALISLGHTQDARTELTKAGSSRPSPAEAKEIQQQLALLSK